MMKKTALFAAALLVIALFLAVPAYPGTIPSSVVPEGARWVVHLDMEKFVGTKLFGVLEKDGKFEMKSRDLDRWLKIDVPRDITGVTVFGFNKGDKGDAVIAVNGKFDRAGLLAMLAKEEDHKEIAHGAYTIYSTDDDEYGAFVNDNLVVLSESREAIQSVLDTAAGKAQNFAKSPLSASLKEVPAGAFLSGVMPDLTGLSRMSSQSKVLEQASGLFFLAQEKQDTLLVRLQVTAASPESAKNMADIVQGIIAMGRMGGNEGDMAKIASLLDGLQVKLEGKVLRLDFERPSQEIAELLSHGRGLSGILD
jgi:hypothetical protein